MTPTEEHLIFYYQIGLAVTQWSHVELALFDTVAACFDGPEPASVSAFFFSIENFRSKLGAADNLVALKCRQTPPFQDWLLLYDG